MTRLFKFFTLFLFAFILVTCSSEGSENEEEVDPTLEEVIIKPNVIVIDPDISSLDSTSEQIEDGNYVITFTQDAPIIKTGDVLVSGEGSGYLRKVTSVSQDGSTYNLNTSQATLEDVFEKAEFSLTTDLSSLKNGKVKVSEPNLVYMAKGLSQRGQSRSGFQLNIQDQAIYNDGPTFLRLTNGKIVFNPSFDIDFKFENGSLQVFRMESRNATLSLETDFELGIGEVIDLVDYKVELFESETRIVIPVGGIPVVFELELELEAELKINATAAVSVNSGFKNETIADIGLNYNNGSWSGLFEGANLFEAKPFAANASIALSEVLVITPEVSLDIYGVLGPYITPELSQDLSFQVNQSGDWDAELKCGIQPKIGVEAEVLGVTVFDFFLDLDPAESVIYSRPTTVVEESGNNQSGVQGSALEEPISVTILDSGDDPLEGVRVYFLPAEGNGTVSEEVAETYENGIAQSTWTLGSVEGTQTLEVKVKKANGQFIESTVTFNATGEAPSGMLLEGNMDFGGVEVGQGKGELLTITNLTEEDMIINQINTPEGFSSTLPNGTVIEPQGSQSTIIVFEPTEETAYTGIIEVVNSIDQENNTIATSGNGFAEENETQLLDLLQSKTWLLIDDFSVVLNVNCSFKYVDTCNGTNTTTIDNNNCLSLGSGFLVVFNENGTVSMANGSSFYGYDTESVTYSVNGNEVLINLEASVSSTAENGTSTTTINYDWVGMKLENEEDIVLNYQQIVLTEDNFSPECGIRIGTQTATGNNHVLR